MTRKFKWTNASVLSFAEGVSPVEAMETKARNLVLRAMDDGWGGPPFDPLALAKWLGIRTEARGDIPDARLLASEDGGRHLEYNPMRPRGRLRFSIAHEIAHTLFDDWDHEVRHRNGDTATQKDNWQLEVLCNIGAAELLMPLGSFTELAGEELSIQKVMDVRKSFDVSVEACLIRLIKLARTPCAAFCASMHDHETYRIDYIIPATGWDCPLPVGQSFSHDGPVAEASAIGFTSVGQEEVLGSNYRVECVGLAPYPGQVVPRVVGFLTPSQPTDYEALVVTEVDGDALVPRGSGPKLVAHVIPDTSSTWGGNGFASQVRKKFPHVWEQFRSETCALDKTPKLGQVFVARMGEGISVAHMVAQRGYGASKGQQLGYEAFAKCLSEVRVKALEMGATVHMPRVGTGHGGANWEIVRELITEELVDKGVPTTIYRLPV
ncbi:ImmA/IrrE family metallo-endopeptidase [Pseudomonas sp. GM25]|uniref:ImmA/IrrE family metallo-endopeptidase n=1 Tax=Pseudomonas sp. GM25 TaxID=1144327 RepID=UPI000270259E|nr:ImmA/IrrE family metallo-endopeptidase [Pseudomonas sp. GM25]EJM29539.1 putative Zn peptidase [Pseudomonas sp. GM25]